MSSYNIIGADDNISIKKFYDDAGDHKSWEDLKAAAIVELKTRIATYSGVTVKNQKYHRMVALLKDIENDWDTYDDCNRQAP